MRRTMLRIGLWTLIGATMACFLTLLMMIGPRVNVADWTIVTVTVPASVVLPRSRPVTYYEVICLNAAIYGLIGLAFEPLFRLSRQLPAQPR